MLRSIVSRGPVLAMLLAGWSHFGPTAAAEQAAEPPEAVWTRAEGEIDRIEERLQELQQKFQSAEAAEQDKLRGEAMQLVDSIKKQFRSLGAVAPQLYAAKAAAPAPAGEKAKSLTQQALGLAFTENRYTDAMKIADAMAAADPKDAVALNFAGVTRFAVHDFQKSAELLQQAQRENLLIPELGGRYLEDARNYVGFWQAESKLREQEAALTGDQQLPRVRLTTTRGNIVVELFEDQAPNTVANFISLVEKSYYDGSPFHRVIPNFMAQGGTPGTKFAGQSGPGYTIDCECYRPDARRHFAGSLSMAHAGKDTGGSQFFLTHLPTPHLNPQNDSVHTVFGRVVEGMDVVAAIQQGDEITKAEVVRKRNHPYQPKTNPSNR